MLKCKNKIWLENIPELFCSLNIIPLDGMTLESQLNALTRLVIVIFTILLLLNFRYSYLFLLLSLLFIIILYYIQRHNMEQYKAEHFTPHKRGRTLHKRGHIEKKIHPDGQVTTNLLFDNPTSYRFCDDVKRLDYNDPNYISENQRLVGKPNPKTLIPPIVVPPPADLGYWKANNLIHHSAINEASQIDVSRSGYQVSTCCGDVDDKYFVPAKNPHKHVTSLQCDAREKYRGNSHSNFTPNNQQKKENFEMPYMKKQYLENQSGQVNTSCGYNPRQLQTAGLPTNYPAGNCERDPVFKNYNDNLFTQTLQPGVYTRNEINEPINANIGISHTQQFPPLTCKTTPDGGVLYTENDPRIIEPVSVDTNTGVTDVLDQANIFDPRHSGYGTSYRSYTDEQLGQTRFYYDDIDAVKMPNYITRSNIDFAPFADSYGPKKDGEQHGNKYNSDIRALANDAFLRSTIQQRTELQERLMRKNSARAWQQRMAPIRTGGQRMAGSMSCG